MDSQLGSGPSATELELTQELEKARARIAELEKALAAAQQNTSVIKRSSQWRSAQKRASLRA
jgi:hypothetical protein